MHESYRSLRSQSACCVLRLYIFINVTKAQMSYQDIHTMGFRKNVTSSSVGSSEDIHIEWDGITIGNLIAVFLVIG